ncbi:MAG: hypothetical protein KF816_17540, partial [Melioribacteraceae bacterium]|nr:hypothetical protein [Melioribacteraceae bacterium]
MKIIVLLFLFSIAYSYSQSQTTDPYLERENCLKNISQERKAELDRLESSYFENNPDPSRFVYLACFDHFPKYRCVKHKKQCSGNCDCKNSYTTQANYIEANYKQLEESCERKYKAALAVINSQPIKKPDIAIADKPVTGNNLEITNSNKPT